MTGREIADMSGLRMYAERMRSERNAAVEQWRRAVAAFLAAAVIALIEGCLLLGGAL